MSCGLVHVLLQFWRYFACVGNFLHSFAFVGHELLDILSFLEPAQVVGNEMEAFTAGALDDDYALRVRVVGELTRGARFTLAAGED